MSRISNHFKYKGMAVGISMIEKEYTFFVINKNVTWHANIFFKKRNTAELAAKQYIDKMLSLDREMQPCKKQ